MYVSPEQVMKDRAEFARQGVAKGRCAVVMRYCDGIVFVAENSSATLHKFSEIYDRIGFAGVGRYNQFENLRIAGIRWADLRGFSYDRADVSARSLANAYAQTLGAIFVSAVEMPYEVELAVAELGECPELDRIYKITYDGSVTDSNSFSVLGANPAVRQEVEQGWHADLSLVDALKLGAWALGQPGESALELASLEAAVLDRTRSQPRKFSKLSTELISQIAG